MKSLFLIPILCFTILTQAQDPFYSTVKIEFEKTMNVHAYYKEVDEDWFNWIKDRWPKTVTNYYEFTGDSTKSIYKPGRETTIDPRSGYRPVADQNLVYND
jgi:hypothetical protein